MFKYALIVGQGRSGTNWLLDLLDQSPKTHCRNEPDKLADVPLKHLPSPVTETLDSENMEKNWDGAVKFAAAHIGERDHKLEVSKDYLWPSSKIFGGVSLLLRPRVRKAMSALQPSLKGSEWPLPWWVGSQTALDASLHILKLVAAPGWPTWVLRNRPGVPVVHIVRHPGGFLNSWKSRYLAKHDPDSVLAANLDRMRRVAESDQEWAARLNGLDRMGVAELELWYWRYAAEMIHKAGSDSKDYHYVNYEHLTSDTVNVAKGVYKACGLEWSEDVERGILASASQSKEIAAAWRERLGPEDVALVERILDGSPLSGLWQG